jgi:hypothetical protein
MKVHRMIILSILALLLAIFTGTAPAAETAACCNCRLEWTDREAGHLMTAKGFFAPEVLNESMDKIRAFTPADKGGRCKPTPATGA